MLPNVRLLSTWQPMQMYVGCCHSVQGVDTLKNCLKAFSPVGSISEASTICLLLFGVQRTKDGSSLSIVRMSCCITLVGLNFIGAKGVGKKVRIMRCALS